MDNLPMDKYIWKHIIKRKTDTHIKVRERKGEKKERKENQQHKMIDYHINEDDLRPR